MSSREALAWVASLAVGVLWLSQTSFKPAPVILADEWVYRSQVAFIPYPQHEIPNYLYSAVYGLTSHLADFYRATQIINLLFFIGFCVVVYHFARLFSSKLTSGLLAFGTLLSPLGLFVGFHMPEAMYFFLVSLAIYLFTKSLLLALVNPRAQLALFAGGFFTLLAASFVKPHAILFLVVVSFAYLFISGKEGEFSRALKIGIIAGVPVWVGLKLAIGYIVAGRDGLVVFGRSYEATLIEQLLGQAPGVLLAAADEFSFAPSEGEVSWATLAINLAVLVIAGAVLLWFAAGYLGKETKRSFQFVFFVSAAVMILIVLFQIIITRAGDNHTDRLLFRHVEFLAPLLIAPWLGANSRFASQTRTLFVGLLVSAALIFLAGNAWTLLADSVFLYSISGQQPLAFVAIAASFLLLMILRKPHLSAIAVAASLVLMSVLALPKLEIRTQVSAIEQTVSRYKDVTNSSEIPALFSSRKQEAASFLFLLDRGIGNYSVIQLKQEAALNLLEGSFESAVVLGDLEVTSDSYFEFSVPGYSRIYLSESNPFVLANSDSLALKGIRRLEPSPAFNAFGAVIRTDTVIELAKDFSTASGVVIRLVGDDPDFGGASIFLAVGEEVFVLEVPEFGLIEEFTIPFPMQTQVESLEIYLDNQNITFTIAGVEPLR